MLRSRERLHRGKSILRRFREALKRCKMDATFSEISHAMRDVFTGWSRSPISTVWSSLYIDMSEKR